MLVKTFAIVDANDQSIIDCTDVFFLDSTAQRTERSSYVCRFAAT